MTTAEAIEICERWFAHIEAQRLRAAEMQRLADMALDGQLEAAQIRLLQIDFTPRVFDGAALEPAVRHLIKLARRQ